MNDQNVRRIILKPRSTDKVYIMGCIAMWSGRSLPTFQRKILPSCSGSKASQVRNQQKEDEVGKQTTLCIAPS
jgi:hypothetical protein